MVEAYIKVFGNTGIGSVVTFLLTVLNVVFIGVLFTADIECLKAVEGVVAADAVCYDMWSYGNDDGLPENSWNHENGRLAFLLTIITLMGYLIFMGVRIGKWFGQADEFRMYQLPISVLLWVLHLVSLILFLEVKRGGHEDVDPDGVLHETKIGWIIMILLLVFSTIITVRYAILRFMPKSSTASYVKGQFGAGNSARVAEQFPIMGSA